MVPTENIGYCSRMQVYGKSLIHELCMRRGCCSSREELPLEAWGSVAAHMRLSIGDLAKLLATCRLLHGVQPALTRSCQPASSARLAAPQWGQTEQLLLLLENLDPYLGPSDEHPMLLLTSILARTRIMDTRVWEPEQLCMQELHCVPLYCLVKQWWRNATLPSPMLC